MWYTEIQQYDFSKPGFSSATENFSQVVWKSTSQVGCGIAMGPKTADGRYRVYGVCQYKDPGNVVSSTTDLFTLNVLPIENIPVIRTTPFVLPSTTTKIATTNMGTLNAASTTGSTLSTCATDFQNTNLIIHNHLRALHHAPALVTTASLQISATAWAERIAKSGSFQKSGTAGVGENLAGVTAFQETLENCGGESFIHNYSS